MEVIGTLVVILAIGGGAIAAISFILARGNARAEGEAALMERLADYAGPNRL